jgi:hypothetical protein
MLSSEIGCPTCSELISIRDVQDFTRPLEAGTSRAPARLDRAMPTAAGTVAGNRRLLRELASIEKQDPTLQVAR